MDKMKQEFDTEIERYIREALNRMNKRRLEAAINQHKAFIKLMENAVITHKPYISKN